MEGFGGDLILMVWLNSFELLQTANKKIRCNFIGLHNSYYLISFPNADDREEI